MGNTYPIILAVIFYPALLGRAMAWAIPFFIALAVIAVRVAIRQKEHRLFSFLWFLLAIYIGILPVLGFIGADIHKKWIA